MDKSEVLILPMIDLDPNDTTCIYSTLLYIQEQASRLNLPTACVTFDQPLWLKAMEIKTAKCLDKIVLRLGGFHLLMSACSSLFHTMKGSGVEDALCETYGQNAVTHMMSGKAIARSLRGLYLIETALTSKLLAPVLPSSSGSEVESGEKSTDIESNESFLGEAGSSCTGDLVDIADDRMDIADERNNVADERLHVADERMDVDGSTEKIAEKVTHLEKLANGVLDLSITPHAIAHCNELVTLDKDLEKVKASLSAQSKTATLWIQFLEYIKVIKDFISFERLGMWVNHLLAVSKFLNLFAATGQIHYAKSARLYLQEMQKLVTSHPWLYSKLIEDGFHTVRRSPRQWSGLWTDLIIEYVLMRSLKSRGGLTRGRGMTESVRHQWVYTMHVCATVHDAMSTLTGKQHQTSEQNVDMGRARRNHDWRDMRKIMEWFVVHDPFDGTVPQLRSLASCLTAREGDGINCDETEKVGEAIQRSMDGKSVSEATMKRSWRYAH